MIDMVRLKLVAPEAAAEVDQLRSALTTARLYIKDEQIAHAVVLAKSSRDKHSTFAWRDRCSTRSSAVKGAEMTRPCLHCRGYGTLWRRSQQTWFHDDETPPPPQPLPIKCYDCGGTGEHQRRAAGERFDGGRIG